MNKKRKETKRVINAKKQINELLEKGNTKYALEKEIELPSGTLYLFLKNYKGSKKGNKTLVKIEKYLKMKNKKDEHKDTLININKMQTSFTLGFIILLLPYLLFNLFFLKLILILFWCILVFTVFGKNIIESVNRNEK